MTWQRTMSASRLKAAFHRDLHHVAEGPILLQKSFESTDEQ
jgi:hypothetical protein